MTLRLPHLVPSSPRPLTGRAVLAMLVAFFAVVMVVNVFMMRAAISTFGGVDTPSSYQAGLVFKADEAAARAQAARDWNVTAHLSAIAGGDAIVIDVHDGDGRPVIGADLSVRLVHPIDERQDVDVAMQEIGGGAYRGAAPVELGRRILDIVVARNGETLFRSHNRIVIH